MPRVLMAPLPDTYASAIPLESYIIPPVGKSGPFINSIISSEVALGCFIRWLIASTTSPKLCGGILVAIPTAIPSEPFTRRFGSLAGRTEGSFFLSS